MIESFLSFRRILVKYRHYFEFIDNLNQCDSVFLDYTTLPYSCTEFRPKLSGGLSVIFKVKNISGEKILFHDPQFLGPESEVSKIFQTVDTDNFDNDKFMKFLSHFGKIEKSGNNSHNSCGICYQIELEAAFPGLSCSNCQMKFHSPCFEMTESEACSYCDSEIKQINL